MPEGGKRTPLALSYTWGQSGLESQFGEVFQPGQGIFSPGYPLAPAEPEATRRWDFPVGVNTIYTPRAYEPISFAELRALAEAHDITRLAIETRKDQLEKLDWTIKPKSLRVPSADTRARAARLAQFWRRPDGEQIFTIVQEGKWRKAGAAQKLPSRPTHWSSSARRRQSAPGARAARPRV